MAKPVTVGEDAPEKLRACAHCGETFDGPEFINFMLQRSSDRMPCIRCDKISYFVNRGGHNPANYIWLVTLFIVSLVPLLAGLGWAVAFYWGYIDVLLIWAPIGAALLTMGLLRASYKIFIWRLYSVQDDPFALQMDFD